MAAAVAESVELLDIAELQSRLLLDPVPQARFQCAVRQRIERAKRQRVRRFGVVHDESTRALFGNRNDRRRKTDQDGMSLAAHGRELPRNFRGSVRGGHYNSSSASGSSTTSPSKTRRASPIVATAATMRPSRPKRRSAWRTINRLGWACGAWNRKARAIRSSWP